MFASNDICTIISGGDTGKRHFVSHLQLRLSSFLFALVDFNSTFIHRHLMFHIDKKYIQPHFDIQNNPDYNNKNFDQLRYNDIVNGPFSITMTDRDIAKASYDIKDYDLADFTPDTESSELTLLDQSNATSFNVDDTNIVSEEDPQVTNDSSENN